MPLDDEVMSPQALSEQNEEAGAALSSLPEVPPWTGEVSPAQRDGGALGRGPWDSSDRSALLKNKLKALLAAPRSLRRSSCFGGRIDRIGTQSGLGCNSFRVRGTGDGNGTGRKEVGVSLSLTPHHRSPPGDAFSRKGTSIEASPLGISAPTWWVSHESRDNGIILSYSLLRKCSGKKIAAMSIGPLKCSWGQVTFILLIGRSRSSRELSGPKGQLKFIRTDLISV